MLGGGVSVRTLFLGEVVDLSIRESPHRAQVSAHWHIGHRSQLYLHWRAYRSFKKGRHSRRRHSIGFFIQLMGKKEGKILQYEKVECRVHCFHIGEKIRLYHLNRLPLIKFGMHCFSPASSASPISQSEFMTVSFYFIFAQSHCHIEISLICITFITFPPFPFFYFPLIIISRTHAKVQINIICRSNFSIKIGVFIMVAQATYLRAHVCVDGARQRGKWLISFISSSVDKVIHWSCHFIKCQHDVTYRLTNDDPSPPPLVQIPPPPALPFPMSAVMVARMVVFFSLRFPHSPGGLFENLILWVNTGLHIFTCGMPCRGIMGFMGEILTSAPPPPFCCLWFGMSQWGWRNEIADKGLTVKMSVF